MLLEKLSAKERAVFILKESFSYSHEEIADILSFSREQSRKLLSRAKATLFKSSAANSRSKKAKTNEKILDNYIAAIRNRDLKTLEKLLIDEITLCADGGDHVQVVQKIASGASAVIEISLYVFHNYSFKNEITVGELNHQPALLYHSNGKITSCQIFNFDDSYRITQICSMVDPQKLKNLNNEFRLR
ncbi:sigma factor-like helix-turn-helix DNA-binding protein [Mucilaginibacter agri]|uniref:RNA polymerase sigma factor 70 region 4 type 2 domain-containing protein n=1 Tax=Mucilaginibacter agri TaxID=2695265 RepID=A0A965ZE89_9SPHI|nr:sigma factor-like helix-turn-helix DNA-binding protein [Mucilaginibacter agri]NCD69110.1 hypothetical protein [Mucilaginibacter agri]